MRNTIKCVITGKERITNKSYLKKRCDAVGVTEEQFRQYYVTRPELTKLKKRVLEVGVINVQKELNISGDWTENDVLRMINQNGVRQKKVEA